MSNCGGCDRLLTCEQGNRSIPLWEKYVSLFPFEIGKQNHVYAKKFSGQRKFTSADVDWLTIYLNAEQIHFKKTCSFGKCGSAYARYVRWKNGIENIELALKKAKTAP